MAAHAPAPAPAGPTLGQLLGAVVNPPVALGLLVANKIWDPLADYIGYPCDRQRRMDDHKHAVQRVIAMRDDFLLIGPCPPSLQSKHWIKCVEQLEKTFSEIQEKYLKGGYFNTCSCAREAIKETKRAEELAGQYKDLCTDTKARLLPVSGSQCEDVSLVTNSYKDLVIKFINDTSGKARLLGIWGMAGIGKSTLLRQVSKSRSELISDGDDLLVLIVDAGSDCSIAKVQKCMIGLLGVTVAADVTEAGVALAICNRLRGMRFLVMLDGLSDPIDLARIGIPDAPPADIKCQKVVFTTQKQSVCASMGANETIQMVCPSEIEAEKLFNHAVGANMLKDKRISSLSRMIINECGRLPEALWKVGRSLSIKEKPEEWEVAVELLRVSKLCMVTYQNDDLIDRLRVNYNDLEENLKNCFLLCSLWSQDANIPIKDLIQWWRGMNLLNELNGHAEGYAYVRMLQQLSLLERGENSPTSNEDSHVRMNPMMHKVVKQILNARGVTWAPNSSWRPPLTENNWLTAQIIWASQRDVQFLSRKISRTKKLLSNLNVLIARCSITFEICQFEGITFLDMKEVRLGAFPYAICTMFKLQYLNLSSTGITEVPLEMRKLSNLKYLFLRNNKELAPLPTGLIGELEKLTEFDVFATRCFLDSFFMTELQRTDHEYLMLGLTVKSMGPFSGLSKFLCILPRLSLLYLCLQDLQGCATIDLYKLSGIKKLRELCIMDCTALSLVAEVQDETQDVHQLLPALQLVAIRSLSNLREVNLKAVGVSITSISISVCPALIDLSWIKDLINLEQLSVTHCSMLKKILSLDVAQQDTVSMPKLKTVHLEGLQELTVIADLTLKLDNIVHFSVFLCSKLVGLPVVGERKPKVILDCDRNFSDKILQDGNESPYSIRVA